MLFRQIENNQKIITTKFSFFSLSPALKRPLLMWKTIIIFMTNTSAKDEKSWKHFLRFGGWPNSMLDKLKLAPFKPNFSALQPDKKKFLMNLCLLVLSIKMASRGAGQKKNENYSKSKSQLKLQAIMNERKKNFYWSCLGVSEKGERRKVTNDRKFWCFFSAAINCHNFKL